MNQTDYEDMPFFVCIVILILTIIIDVILRTIQKVILFVEIGDNGKWMRKSVIITKLINYESKKKELK